MAILLSFAFVLMTYLGCLEAAQHPQGGTDQGHLFATASISDVANSKDILSNLNSIKESPFLKNVIPDSFASFTDMMKLSTLFDYHFAEGVEGETDKVPIILHPFKVVMRSIREGMPDTIMDFDYNRFNLPINKKARHESHYTPISLLYPVPRLYSGDVPTLEEVYDNPRMIKGFEEAHAHPANREVALRMVDMGIKSLEVIRMIPQLRALREGEPGIPIEISEMPITIVGHPYGDSKLVIPASKIMIPYTGF